MTFSINHPATCDKHCSCTESHKNTKLIVITGGPGAGKTAVLEIIRKQLCEHVVILPEAASIVFGGGFWRLESLNAVSAAQRAILHIQQEMEGLVLGEQKWSLGLCDRGLLDGLAYWPGLEKDFWDAARTSLQAEYDRYHTVIHLRTPTESAGYNHQNPLRTESALQAQAIDRKICSIWFRHPRYHVVESTDDFMVKAQRAIDIIVENLPLCCQAAQERS